jgi:hypothetical protein
MSKISKLPDPMFHYILDQSKFICKSNFFRTDFENPMTSIYADLFIRQSGLSTEITTVCQEAFLICIYSTFYTSKVRTCQDQMIPSLNHAGNLFSLMNRLNAESRM